MIDDILFLIYHGNRRKLVDRAIMDTEATIPGDDAEATHVARYYRSVDLTFDNTLWFTPGKLMPRSGAQVTRGLLGGYAYALRFKVPRTSQQLEAGLLGELADVNGRFSYAFVLLVMDWLLIRTRKFWGWLYRKTGWAPFNGGSDVVCSFGNDRAAKRMGLDLWPGEPESLTVPGDFIQSPALEVVK